MKWTQEQAKAIETRGSNILLSAAAGSGKTTVLVERVLSLLTSGETEIDRLLVVTFTRAAAADMRMKLARELGKRAAEGDEHCRRSQLMLEQASISTLHSFCSEFLRGHFEAAGIDPAFRVLDGTETQRLMDEALEEAVEEAYRAGDEALMQLDYGRGPEGVTEMARILLWALDERPDPEAWLEEMLGSKDIFSLWTGEVMGAARRAIDQALVFCREAKDASDATENCIDAALNDIKMLQDLAGRTEFDDMQRALKEIKFVRVASKRGMPQGDEFKALRNEAKKVIGNIKLKDIDLSVALADAEKLRPQLKRLSEIVLCAQQKCMQKKTELAALSYSDLEHRTLAALRDDAVAQDLRETYDYIFVDEYQDTSDVQEALVSRLSRADNRFMVGDVKQSIYRFRQAEPSLFLDKYERYGRGEGGTLLPLTANFRSRPAILNFVNRVFERAMCGGDSEVTYDALARLNHGNKELTGGSVTVHILEAPDASEDADAADLEVCEREAVLIGKRIRELMAEDPSLKYSDFAILTRMRRGVMGHMAAVLTQMNIPAFAEGTDSYYDSVEVMLALSLLKLTVNRRSDVELIGVLRSPMLNFSVQELALIRVAAPDVPFVEACEAYAKQTDDLAERLQAFFTRLDGWHLLSMNLGLGQLCRRVIDESGLYECAGALPGGAQRQCNLDQLCLKADRYDQNISGALTRFLRYCEKLRASGSGDDAPALASDEDAVRLMTVHKSKGLEFPVVFGAMLNRGYNTRGGSDALSVHRELGLGCCYCDPELQSRRKTLPQYAIDERELRESSAEELRILYVLLTRAKDRLELVGSIKAGAYEKQKMRWHAMVETPGAAKSHLDVIMPALEDAPEGLCEVVLHRDMDYSVLNSEGGVSNLLSDIAPAGEDDALLQMLSWKYADADAARQPLKLTVTGMLREVQGPEAPEPLLERPNFMAETPARMTGTERGTAYHRAMELLDFAPLRGLNERDCTREIARQLDSFAENGRMQLSQREAVSPSVPARFFGREVGRRLISAEYVRREWPFNVMMRMSEALRPEEMTTVEDREILVQGTLDCCFIEDGQWVLLDYKTDRSNDAQALTAHYRNQLRLYALALERITERPVKEIRLCLLMGGEDILIDRGTES